DVADVVLEGEEGARLGVADGDAGDLVHGEGGALRDPAVQGEAVLEEDQVGAGGPGGGQQAEAGGQRPAGAGAAAGGAPPRRAGAHRRGSLRAAAPGRAGWAFPR